MKERSRLETRYDGALYATIGGIVDRVRDRGRKLDLDDGDRLEGKVIVVTGANRGLGLAVARALADRGATSILACRSGLDRVVDDVTRGKKTGGTVEAMKLDLGELASVERFVDTLAARKAQLDVVVLNAGIVPSTARKTGDGLDESFQVNFLSNALLMCRLVEKGVMVPSPKADARPRFVVVSSESHRTSKPIDWSTFGQFRNWKMREAVEQYGYAKLLLQTFTEELARRTTGRFAVHSVCPGAVNTDLGREAPKWAKPALDLTMKAFFKSPEEGAIPVVYLVAAKAISNETGIYYHVKRRRDSSDDARDRGHGKRIWAESQRVLGELGHPIQSLVEESK